MQKCLDKDPAKRWTCERLMNHQLFEEYIARRKEATVEQTDDSNRPREKSKVKLNKKKKITHELRFKYLSIVNSHRTRRCRCWRTHKKSAWIKLLNRRIIPCNAVNTICRRFNQNLTPTNVICSSSHQDWYSVSPWTAHSFFTQKYQCNFVAFKLMLWMSWYLPVNTSSIELFSFSILD